MLHAKGFGPRWIKWVEKILYSATTSVLLNGVAGKIIKCRRGVRQGDPLSPLLYVLTADLLQSIVNHAWQSGEINLPIDDDFGMKYPIFQYADDTLMIMPACIDQIMHLKALLQAFSRSTGLFINYAKSSLVPINIDHDHAKLLADEFGCQVESLPFTYLGLPLGTTKPSVQDLMPVIAKIDKRLSGVSNFLNYAGRLTYINSVIASMPIFTMCTIKIHHTIWNI